MERQKLPLPEEQTEELNLPIATSPIDNVAATEQLKAGNKEVKTEDKKDGVDEAHSFMRNSYWFDDKVSETFIPLNERKVIFRFKYPNGALSAKLTSNTYKSASADAAVFRDTNDSQPFATDSGAANLNDLPYILKKKTAQVAVSNATYRVLNQAGIPMTLSELFLMIQQKEIDEGVVSKLNSSDAAFINGWEELKRKQAYSSSSANEWTDVDDLEEQLHDQEYKIQIGDSFFEQSEVVEAISNEIIIGGNDALASELLGVFKQVAEIKGASEEPKQENKQQTPSKTKTDKTKSFFTARDIKTGHIVKRFASRKEAAEFAGISPNSISQVLNPSARNKTAGGYLWNKEEKKVK